jgi:hypothetical protein
MRLLNLTTLLMFIIYTPLLPASPDKGMHRTKDEQANQAQGSLELATSIVRQRYCKSSDPAAYNTLRLDLRLRYKNIGQQDLILYKGSSIAYREMVSANVQDAARMHYILDLSLMVDVQGLPEIDRGPIPDKNFIILQPGARFEPTTSTEAVLFLKRSDEEKVADAFGSGEYVLQVQVSTFPYPQSLENELRQRWKTSGELWTSGITSGPMTFNVEKDRKAFDCNP